MSLLSALVSVYERDAARGEQQELPPVGFSIENLDFVIPLDAQGNPGRPIDLRNTTDRGKLVSARRLLPQPPKRAAAIAPAFLWDKSAYALGIGSSRRLESEHAAFVALHRAALAGTDDEGLRALLAFLDAWNPADFAARGWPEELVDSNIAFALEQESGRQLLHERSAAIAAWARQRESSADEATARCLASGASAALARLHPSIKGVWGAQSSGASIVSFNLPAFESYGHKQGANAPVSSEAAFKYTTVLNHFLARDSRHRLQLGDTSCVFWADASDDALAAQAERLGAGLFGADLTVDPQADRPAIEAVLAKVRQGVPIDRSAPEMAEGVTFHVLGLSPNAARLSVRFWFQGSFGSLLERWQRLWAHLEVAPPASDGPPALWRYLPELAVQRKRENVPPRLFGDWFQAVLTGGRYPRTLLSLTIVRIRADGDVNARRASILRAVLVRNHGLDKEAPVALDENNEERGYRLGRLFAIYEEIQRAALGAKLNTTVKDKYYGAASARPLGVFPLLDRGAAHHLSKLGKLSPGRRIHLERLLGSVMEGMSPDQPPWPATLPLADQALFALGYYHQRSSFFTRKAASDAAGDEDHQGSEDTQ